MTAEIKELASYRMEQAKEALRSAEDNLKNNHLKTAVNRAYYSAFYAVRALLATKNLDSSKHSGIISLFNQHFVKTGVINKEFSLILRKAFDLRIDGDYKDFIEFDLEKINEIIAECKKFIEKIEETLKEVLK